MKSESILISGGLGFIGLNLVHRLKKDNEITVIDNLSTSTYQEIEGVEVIIGNTSEVLATLKPNKYDKFFHFGEYSRVEQSLNDFEMCMTSNFGTLTAVLSFCKAGNIKLVYSGSSTKFTIGATGKDLSPYTWSKCVNTDLIERFANWYSLNYAICYFYNVYGSGEISSGEYSTVVGKFINAYKKSESVQITLPGTQRRNFTHIEDTLDALLLIGEKGFGDGYCIANETAYSILEVASILGLKYEFRKENRANRLDASYDLKKMQDLGWCANRSLSDYLKNHVL